MLGLKHLSFTAALLLIAVKGQGDDTYDRDAEYNDLDADSDRIIVSLDDTQEPVLLGSALDSEVSTFDFEQEVGQALRKIGDSGSYDYKTTTSSYQTTSSQEQEDDSSQQTNYGSSSYKDQRDYEESGDFTGLIEPTYAYGLIRPDDIEGPGGIYRPTGLIIPDYDLSDDDERDQEIVPDDDARDYPSGLIIPDDDERDQEIVPDDEWKPIVGPDGIDPNAIVEKPKPIQVDKLGDLGDWFKAGSIQSEIMSSFSIKELEQLLVEKDSLKTLIQETMYKHKATVKGASETVTKKMIEKHMKESDIIDQKPLCDASQVCWTDALATAKETVSKEWESAITEIAKTIQENVVRARMTLALAYEAVVKCDQPGCTNMTCDERIVDYNAKKTRQREIETQIRKYHDHVKQLERKKTDLVTVCKDYKGNVKSQNRTEGQWSDWSVTNQYTENEREEKSTKEGEFKETTEGDINKGKAGDWYKVESNETYRPTITRENAKVTYDLNRDREQPL